MKRKRSPTEWMERYPYLRRCAEETVKDVLHWCRTREQKEVKHFSTKRKTLLLLLNLRAWSFRYKLSIPDILDLVVHSLRTQSRREMKSTGILGISVQTLVGKGAERILQEKISVRFPEDEHIAMWRHREQLVQLERERREDDEDYRPRVHETLIETADLSAYAKRYRRRVLAAREEFTKEQEAEWRQRKRYRGNPWIL